MRRPVPGFPGYEVDEFGNVWTDWSISSKPARTSVFRQMKWNLVRGYPSVSAKTKDGRRTTAYVHCMVLLAFVGPRPDGHHACHIDGNPANPHVSNLRWGTQKSNGEDKVRHGRSPRGRKNVNNRLSEESVRDIKSRLATGTYGICKQLADEYGVSEMTIYSIKVGRTYAYVQV